MVLWEIRIGVAAEVNGCAQIECIAGIAGEDAFSSLLPDNLIGDFDTKSVGPSVVLRKLLQGIQVEFDHLPFSKLV